MALSRAKKDDLLEVYREGFASSEHAFLVSFEGMSVPQATSLRDLIRDQGGHYVVVKNTLAKRAIDGQHLSALDEHFTGPTAVAYSDDPVGLAKALADFRKEVPAVEFKAGLVEGRPVAAEEVEGIAKLPSRDELLAKLLFLLQSPVTRFVRTLAAVPRDFVVVMGQIAKQKED